MGYIQRWAFLLLLVFLSACGGGDGDTIPPSTNTTPTLSLSVNAVTLDEDFGTFIINTTATDVEDGTLSVTVSGQAGLLTTNATTDQITLTSIANANGTTTLTVSATDSGALTVSTEVVVIVNAANDTPTLTFSTTQFSLNANFMPQTIATATDVDDASLLLTFALSATDVVQITTVANRFILNPITNAFGETTITLTATDSSGNQSSQRFTVHVNASIASTTPTLALSTQRITLDEDFGTFVINTTASDAEDGVLPVAVTGQDASLFAVTTSTDQIILTSVANATGIATLTVSIVDSGNLSATTEVVVVVNGINDSPTLTLSTTNLSLSEDFGTFVINTTASDAEDGVLPVAVTGQDASLFAVTTSTDQIILTSVANATGIATLTVSIVDSGNLSATTEVVVVVNGINDSPTLTLSTTNLSLSEDFGTFVINTTASDAENGRLPVAVTGQDASLFAVTTSTDQIILTSVANANGTATLTVSIVDSGNLSATTEVVVVVNGINSAPALTLSTTNLSLSEDFGTFVINTTATDVEDGVLPVAVTGQDASLFAVTTSTDQIILTSVANANGTATLTVSIVDSGNISATTEVVVVVNAINDSPTLTLSTTNLSLSEDFGTFVINTTASDAEDGVLPVAVTGQDASLFAVTTSTDQIILTSVANANGTATLTVSIVGSGNLSATTEVVVVVNAINDSPTLTLSTTNLSLSEDFGTFIINTTATDAEDGVLPVAVTGQDASLFAVTTSTDQIILTSVANANGIATLTVSIVDSGNLSATTEVVVVVNAINDSPTLTLSTTNLSLSEDFGTFVINTTASDAEDGVLPVAVTGQDASLFAVTTSTDQIILTSVANANGTATLTVSIVGSGNLSATTEVVVVVNAINDSPTLTLSTTNLSLSEDFGTFIINTTATDAEDGVLPVAVTGQDASLFAVTTSTDQIILTSVANANGIATLTVSIVDSGNLSATTEVVVVVNAINDSPTLTLSTTNLSLSEDFGTFVINTTATDVEDGVLPVAVTGQDASLFAVTTSTDQIILTSVANANGTATLTVSIVDSGNLSASTEVVVVVNAINDSPTLTLSTTNLSLSEDFGTFVINTTASDAEDGVLPVAVTGQDASLFAVSTSTDQIILTSVANANGTATLTVSIVDSGNLSASTEVIVIVNGINSSPALTLSTTNLSLSEDFGTFVINTTASDAEDGVLPVAVTGQDASLFAVTTSANQIILTSVANANGRATLTVSIVDSGNLSASTEVVVLVNAVNDTPTLTFSTTQFSLNANFTPQTIATATDVDDASLLLTFALSATDVVQITTVANRFILNPITNAFGETTITLTATDNSGNQSSQIFTVRVNGFPTLALSTQRVTLDEDFGTFVINTTASDAEDGVLPVAVTGQDASLFAVTTSTNQIMLTSIANANGIATLTVSIVDSGNLSATTEVVVVVNAINDNPTLTLSTTNLSLSEDFGTFVINTTASDAEDGVLPVGVTGQDASLFAVTTSTDQIILTSVANANGIATLTVSIVDSGNLSATTEVVVVVNAINDSPTLTLSTTNLSLSEDFGTFVINTTASDAEDGVLPIAVTGQDASLFAVTTTTNQIILTSVANANGRATLTVSIVDSGNLSATTEVVVVVNAINDSPTLTLSTTNLSLSEDFGTFVINTTASDAEDGVLPVAVTGQDASLFAVTTSTDQIILTSVANANGTATLTVSIVDSGNLSATTEVVVVINAINDSPTLTLSTTNLSLSEDFGTFVINTTASDAEDGLLPVAVTGQDASLFAVTTSADQIILTSVANANGTATLTVSIVGSGNLSATTEVVVVVNAINDSPTLTLSTTNLSLSEDFGTFIINTTATDAEDGVLPVAVTGQDASLFAVTTSTNQIILTSVANATGIATLTVSIVDSGNLSATTEVVVVVNAVNDTPTLSLSSTNLTLTANTTALITAFGVDVETSSASLIFSVQQNPSLLQVSTQGNVIVLRAGATTGSTTLVITVTDGDGLSTSATAQVTVVSGVLNVLNVNLNVKRINFSWNTLPAANHYRMLSNVDVNAGGGFVDASSAGLVFVPNSTNIINTTVSATVDIARYLSTADGPQYLLQACSSVDNSVCSDLAQESLSNIQLEGLIGYFKASNTDADDEFGEGVAISGDGNTLVVGAPFEDSTATSINGDQTNNSAGDSGAAYVFVRSSTGSWRQQAYLKASDAQANDQFGAVVTISNDGNTIVVGAEFKDVGAPGGVPQGDAGAAYVFVRSSTGSWRQQAFISASNLNANDRFGRTVSVAADGNTLAIGAPLKSVPGTNPFTGQPASIANVGTAYVFVRSSTGTWSEQALLTPPAVTLNANFGNAVSMSGDGNTMVVGAVGDQSTGMGIDSDEFTTFVFGSGAAHVFVRSSTGTWSRQAYIKASNSESVDLFGTAVSMSGDGNTMVVGAPQEDSNATGIDGDQANNGSGADGINSNSGAAYVFVRSSTGTWTQDAYIKASNTGLGDEFGFAVSMRSDGNAFVVGAPFEDSNATGINGGQADGANNAGAAYLFVRSSAGTWSQQAYTKASNTGADDAFGSVLSISSDGTTFAVGAPNENSSATGINGNQTDDSQDNAGAAYLY